MKVKLLLFVLLLCSCATTKQVPNYVVIGHETTFDGDTINIVRRTDAKCDKSPVYPIGTILCKGKLKVQ